jgi:hypothetical protein
MMNAIIFIVRCDGMVSFVIVIPKFVGMMIQKPLPKWKIDIHICLFAAPPAQQNSTPNKTFCNNLCLYNLTLSQVIRYLSPLVIL